MKCKFKILVFQNGQLDEEVETEVHEFADGIELGNGMAKFAAMNCHHFRLHPAVCSIVATETTKIQEPRISKGLGVDTYLIIQKVIPAD